MDKELMDCLLSVEEINEIYKEIGFDEDGLAYEKELLNVQLEKCSTYIDNKVAEAVKAERERICLRITQYFAQETILQGQLAEKIEEASK